MLAEKSKGSKWLSDVSLDTNKTAYSSYFISVFIPSIAFGCINSLSRTIKEYTTIVTVWQAGCGGTVL